MRTSIAVLKPVGATAAFTASLTALLIVCVVWVIGAITDLIVSFVTAGMETQ